jgi:hypothetical protein
MAERILRSVWLPPLLAFIGSWFLAALLSWPVIVDPAGGMVGHPGNDAWNHIWGFWWFSDTWATTGRLPSHTLLLNYPDGGTLFFIDGVNALLSIPLQRFFDLPTTYNILVAGCMAWTAFGAWCLAWHVLRDQVGAAVAAVVYGSSAHLLAQAYNGITETINAGWIPLYVLMLLRLLERPRLSRGVALGVVMGLCALANFYYGLFAGILTALVVIHRLAREHRRTRWRPFFGFAALGAAVSLAMVLPVLNQLSATLDADDAMVSRDPQFVWESLLRHNITDVLCYLTPGRFYSPDLKANYGEDLLIVVYLGWVAIGLAVLGVVLRRRRRELGLWGWVFTVFLVLSMGPYLHLDGEYLRFNGRMIPLPFLPFFRAFPLFDRISHPFRFVVPATLALGILAGHGARLLLRGLHRPGRLAGGVVLCGAVLIEVLLGSPAVWPIPRSDARVPSVYADLEGDGAVLDLPITVPNLERAVYTYYQTTHGLPSPFGLNEPLPRRLRQNRLTRFLVFVESGRVMSLPRLLPELDLVAGAAVLRASGYRYVVVHEELLPGPKAELIETVLTAVFGPPRKYPDEGIALYELTR